MDPWLGSCPSLPIARVMRVTSIRADYPAKVEQGVLLEFGNAKSRRAIVSLNWKDKSPSPPLPLLSIYLFPALTQSDVFAT